LTLNPQNLPAGTVVSVGCDTFNPNGAPLAFSAITITDQTQPSTIRTTIPANFRCNLTMNYTISPTVLSVPTNATLSLSVGAVKGRDLYTLGTETVGFSDTIRLAHFHDIYEKKMKVGDAKYSDFFYRDSFGQDNTVPRPDGVESGCVDIQPYGTSPCANSATQFLTDANFAIDYTSTNSIQIQQGTANYIYVRGQNLGPNGAQSVGQMSLYYAPSNLLADPTQWGGNMIMGDNGSAQVDYTCDQNGRAVCTFFWTNPPPPPDGQHYCLLAQVITPSHPNPFPLSFPTQGGLANFILNNLNWGWRNVSYLPASSKTLTQFENFSTGTMSNTTWDISFALTNPPVNSAVSLSSPSQVPVPIININKSTIIDPNVSPGSVRFTVAPANFSTVINVTWYDENQPIPAGFSFAISVLFINKLGSPLYRFGKKLPTKVGTIPQSAISCGKITHCVVSPQDGNANPQVEVAHEDHGANKKCCTLL